MESSHEKFRELYLETLSAELAAKGRSTIDYLVVSHTEPDHSGGRRVCLGVGGEGGVSLASRAEVDPSGGRRVCLGGR